MSTDLNSEFTHFNMVIRLSKVKLSALLLSTVFEESRCSCSPRVFSPRFLSARVKPFETIRNSVFYCSFSFWTFVTTERQAHAFQVWSFFFWWLSGEVKHIVHLIRWNLKAVLCRLGQDLNTGLEWHNARTLGLGAESWFWFCFSLTSSQLVPYLMLSSLPR